MNTRFGSKKLPCFLHHRDHRPRSQGIRHTRSSCYADHRALGKIDQEARKGQAQNYAGT